MAGLVLLALAGSAPAKTWPGLTVAPEHRCAPYDERRDYPYPLSVERDIVRELGVVDGPYTGTCFASTAETDIELRANIMQETPRCVSTVRAPSDSRRTCGSWPCPQGSGSC